MQDLRVSAIRTFPIFTYLNHDRSIRVFRFENKMQPLANICARAFRSLIPPARLPLSQRIEIGLRKAGGVIHNASAAIAVRSPG
jgi:hypothetical protein